MKTDHTEGERSNRQAWWLRGLSIAVIFVGALALTGCLDDDYSDDSGSGGGSSGDDDGIICSCGDATSDGIDLCSEGRTYAQCDGGITANCPATSYTETSCITANPSKSGDLCCYSSNDTWTMYMWDSCTHSNCEAGFRTACANEGGSVGSCPTSSQTSLFGGGGGGGGDGGDPAPPPCEDNNTGTITFWVSNTEAVGRVDLNLQGVGTRSTSHHWTQGSPECGSTGTGTMTFTDIPAATYNFRAEDQDDPPRVWEDSAPVNQCGCTSFELR
jgi:hypothetical protein